MIQHDALAHGAHRHTLEQLLLEIRIELGVHRHIPGIIRREGPAFDRILLGHQHRQIFQEAHITGLEIMVIGQRVRQNPHTGAPHMIKKTPRIANTGYRMHRTRLEAFQGNADVGIGQIQGPITA